MPGHWSGLPFPSPVHESEKWKWSRSVVSDSSRPHGLHPTRLLRPWDFPGKSAGMGCHCLLRSLGIVFYKCQVSLVPILQNRTDFPLTCPVTERGILSSPIVVLSLAWDSFLTCLQWLLPYRILESLLHHISGVPFLASPLLFSSQSWELLPPSLRHLGLSLQLRELNLTLLSFPLSVFWARNT